MWVTWTPAVLLRKVRVTYAAHTVLSIFRQRLSSGERPSLMLLSFMREQTLQNSANPLNRLRCVSAHFQVWRATSRLGFTYVFCVFTRDRSKAVYTWRNLCLLQDLTVLSLRDSRSCLQSACNCQCNFRETSILGAQMNSFPWFFASQKMWILLFSYVCHLVSSFSASHHVY
jgi:hypothetical protein